MNSRDEILTAIRAQRPLVDRPLPAVPAFDRKPSRSLLATFKDSLHRMGGIFLESSASADPLAPVRAIVTGAKVICSVVPEVSGNRDITTVKKPQELADVDVAVVRASFGVIETESVLLSDGDLRINAIAYLAQHLIVLLDPVDLVLNLHLAYRRPEFRSQRYAAFHSGPSATADIEGVLIHGAQGVRSLSVFPARRSHGHA